LSATLLLWNGFEEAGLLNLRSRASARAAWKCFREHAFFIGCALATAAARMASARLIAVSRLYLQRLRRRLA
jgi:hypothetical protein